MKLAHIYLAAAAALLLLIVGVALGPPAAASPPLALPNVEAYQRPAGLDWMTRRTVGATALAVTYASNSGATSTTAPAVFGWGTRITLTASTAATCCLAQTSTLTISEEGLVTDASGLTAQGACVALHAHEPVEVVPIYPVISARPGGRTKVCAWPSKLHTSAGHQVYPPCVVDGDCADAGTGHEIGACVAGTDTTRMRSGAMLVCIAATSIARPTTTIDVRTGQ